MSDSPAEVIRRAAALMRERATRADTGEPWEAGKHYDALWMVDLKPSLGVVDLSEPDKNSLGRADCQSFEQPRFFSVLHEQAEHIASWSPVVALAVAEWLDASAQAWDEGMEWDEALAVARAYLNEVQP